MNFLKKFFNTVPSPFNQASHNSLTLKAMQGKMLKNQFFCGLLHHSHSPVFIDPTKGVLIQTGENAFYQLAHMALQARLKGYRVIWIAPHRTVQDIDALNRRCHEDLDILGFTGCSLSDDRPLAASPDSLFMANLPHRVYSRGQGHSALNHLHRFLTQLLNSRYEQGSQPQPLSSERSRAFAVKGEPFVILEGFTATAIQPFFSLKNLFEAGQIPWVIAPKEPLDFSEPADETSPWTRFREGARFTLTAPSFQTGFAQLFDKQDEDGPQPLDTALWLCEEEASLDLGPHFWPTSVFDSDSPAPLCFVSQDSSRLHSYLGELHRKSTAINTVFAPNLAVEPYFVRDNACSDWYYNEKGEKVYYHPRAAASEFEEEATPATSPCWVSHSMVEMSELLFWTFDAQCPALYNLPDATAQRSRVRALFYEQANLLYKNSKAVSFHAVALLFSNVLKDCGLWVEGKVVPRFEALPSTLKTVIWLQAYRLALPPNTPWGTMAVVFEEPLDVLAELPEAAYLCLAYMVRCSRRATNCFFLPIRQEQYALALATFELGNAIERSWLGILAQHMAALFAVDSSHDTAETVEAA